VVQDQLAMMRLRNTSPAFSGKLILADTDEHRLHMTWKNQGCSATLHADLRDFSFNISHQSDSGNETVLSYR
jgi:sucrose phosphorylase